MGGSARGRAPPAAPRASPSLRRATILAFLAALESEELDEFIRLMFRAFCEERRCLGGRRDCQKGRL